jgi:AmmeMemoRadiSam system protein A
MLQEKKAALVALSNLEDLTLTAIEFCDIDILLQSIPLIKDHAEANQTISHASVVAAVQFAQNLNSNTTTVLKSALDQGVNVNQKIHQASVMLYQYTPPVLVEAQQDTLIQLAKDAITSYITKRETPLYKTDDPAFLRKSGVFVTIRQKGALRGCIGRLQPDMPLYRVVQEIAVAAATSDPRFPPIKKEEIQGLEFKIAVLSPLQRITTDEVQVGKHGLLIAHQGHRGVLLPDVPVSRGWDRETFLANLCLKAGLPPRTWRENPTLYAFTTVEFGDG